MEPFNIRIPSRSVLKTLTILPEPESASYKILYHGAILGALRQQKDRWLAVGQEKVDAGNLPLYNHKFGEGSSDVDLDIRTVSLIAAEISDYLEVQMYYQGQSIH